MSDTKCFCKDCDNFLGGGDWNLCCKNPPEDQVGWCGFLCYEDTEACQNFKPLRHVRLRPDKPGDWERPPADWLPCSKCAFFEDCETKESRDGCYFGEPEEN